MAGYTWVDFIIVLFFFVSTALGFSRGLFKEVISLISVFIALVITAKFTAPIANYLNHTAGAQDVIASISSLFNINAGSQLAQFSIAIVLMVLFMGVYSIGEAVNYYGPFEFFVPYFIPLLYRLLGAVVGFVRGYIFSLLFIVVMSLTPVAAMDAWRQSVLIPSLQDNATALSNKILSAANENVG